MHRIILITSHMKTAFLWLPVFFFLLVLKPAPAQGQEYLKVPLTQLTSVSVAEFRGADASFKINLPISVRWLVLKADLHFNYVSSSALLAERSRLVVKLNGHVLTQVQLNPKTPAGVVDTALSPEFLSPDDNELEFIVTQQYTEACGDPWAPELWTYLELDNSYIEMEYTMMPMPPKLASIANFLFDEKTLDKALVHLVLESFDESYLRLAAIAAAGVALRYGDRPVRFTLSHMVEMSRDNIIIGGRDFVGALLSGGAQALPEANLGLNYLSVDENEIDPGWALIIITGRNPEEMEKAAQTFSVLSYPLPDTPFAMATDVVLPEIGPYSGRGLLASPGRYLFKQLGFEAATFKGLNPVPARMVFRLPSDFLIDSPETISLSLHLTHGASMRADSVMNVFLNNGLAGAVPLNGLQGGRDGEFKMDLPASLLKPGKNILTFQPVMTPDREGDCDYLQTGNLVVTLHDDSKIILPSMHHWAQLPNIGLFFKDGFPMTRWPDWRETKVYLTDISVQTAAAAINLVATICRKTRVCPYKLRFTYTAPKEGDFDILAVGTLETVPELLKNASPVFPMVTYPFEGTSPAVGTGILPENATIPRPRSAQAKVTMEWALAEGKLLVTQFQSPLAASRSVLLVSAQNPRDLLFGALELCGDELQAEMTQGMAIVDLENPNRPTFTQETGPAYYVGERQSRNLTAMFHTRPWAFWAILAGILLVLAGIGRFIWMRHGRKREKA